MTVITLEVFHCKDRSATKIKFNDESMTIITTNNSIIMDTMVEDMLSLLSY